MAVRKSEVRKLRREFIRRKANVWSRLNKSLVKSLDEIIQVWLKKVERYTDDVPDIPAIPDKFTKTLNKTLREALAYGYWLNHIYLQEVRAAYYKTKYRGKITLADKLSDEDKIRASLENLISYGNASEWHDVIPEDAIKWLEGYTPSLAGNLHDSVLEKARDVIRQSMLEGSTLQERMKALRDAASEFEAMTKARIESIARTEITRADIMGTLICNKSNDDVIGYEFSAIMDDRTTDICALRHGLFIKADDPALADNTPPLHVNCRSMLLACTIYDFPDGLNTSHEFMEPEFPSAMQRPEDIEEVKKVLDMKAKSIEISALIDSNFRGRNYVTDGSKISTLDELKEMAGRGEMPNKIEGSQQEQARLYEEIDRLYERPSYVHDVRIQDLGSSVNIEYRDNQFAGIASGRRYPSGRKASTSEREGVTKFQMYYDRAEMELRIHNMFGGFPTPEMQRDFQGKALTEQQKEAVTAEAERQIFKIMKSPVSPAGRRLINQHWTKDNVRIG